MSLNSGGMTAIRADLNMILIKRTPSDRWYAFWIDFLKITFFFFSMNWQAFQRIKEEKPEVMKKLVPIQGDVTFDQLGLSGEQLERVCRETNIVFHCAATLRLEASLKDALDMNTTGTKRVLDVARKMSNLLAFIHLSTAFCYCDQEVLLEKVYDCAHDPNELISIGKWMDAKTLDKITPDILNPHPNTYTYSKRLAEILVEKEYPNMPVCIARPSIGMCVCVGLVLRN